MAPDEYVPATLRFYRDKTAKRLSALPHHLRTTAESVVRSIDWEWLADGCIPSVVHGDFNYGNILWDLTGTRWYGIDWREDFGGELDWGDRRWDFAKLLAGTVVHWDRARLGMFAEPRELQAEGDALRQIVAPVLRDVEVIGALSLLNSAPLHAPPLDEVLVARGVAWLERVL